jgi:hypothetical protein
MKTLLKGNTKFTATHEIIIREVFRGYISYHKLQKLQTRWINIVIVGDAMLQLSSAKETQIFKNQIHNVTILVRSLALV